MFNEDLLIQCNKPKFKGQHKELASPPTIVNEEEEYEVEEIKKYRKQERGLQYLIHWKGYRNKHNQWIVELGLPHAKEMIEDY